MSDEIRVILLHLTLLALLCSLIKMEVDQTRKSDETTTTEKQCRPSWIMKRVRLAVTRRELTSCSRACRVAANAFLAPVLPFCNNLPYGDDSSGEIEISSNTKFER